MDTEVGSIGIGDRFGLYRWAGPAPGDGIQLSISAAVFAQFDLASSSLDMLNADYVVGLPLSIRRGASSARLRLYHQSSHLGDEFLLRDEPERVNLAFESLELIVSRAMGGVRLYGGGEYLFNREPDDLEESLVHLGIEGRTRRLGGAGLLAAVDLKSSEEQEWKPAWSVRGGIETGWGGIRPTLRGAGAFSWSTTTVRPPMASSTGRRCASTGSDSTCRSDSSWGFLVTRGGGGSNRSAREFSSMKVRLTRAGDVLPGLITPSQRRVLPG
jgi:hypothetical protein